MGNLVLIGGGRFADTTPLLHEIISLTEKSDPRVVILPTAALHQAGEQQAYQVWRAMFEPVSSHIEPLYLLHKRLEKEEISERLESADIVYVPGGDTRMMFKVWRRMGVDKILAQIYGKGTVLAGKSAGANAWCRSCICRERSLKKAGASGYRSIWGLGFLDITLCTHYPEGRDPLYDFLETYGGTGLGLDNDQALIVQDDTYRLHNFQADATAYKLTTTENAEDSDMPFVVSAEQLVEPDAAMRPLEALM